MTKTLVDQCGEVFEVGYVTLRCVLKTGHKGSHRATLSVPPKVETLRSWDDAPPQQKRETVRR